MLLAEATADAYNGGATFMAFLAAEFGEDIHARLLRNPASTFEAALSSETKPYSLVELFDRFRKWLDQIQLIQSNEVSLETPTGTLFGTLMLPAEKPPFPVVLLIAGSGMTDTDGNSVGLSGKSNCLKLVAEGLAQSGIASL